MTHLNSTLSCCDDHEVSVALEMLLGHDAQLTEWQHRLLYRCLQIFSLELCKGWDVLLAAFLSQFTAVDNVALYMKTSPYHSDSNCGSHMRTWATEHVQASDGVNMDNLLTLYVIVENMAQDKLRRLYAYASVQCFVLPSRSVRNPSWCYS